MNNQELFDSISCLDGTPLFINLDENFQDSLEIFRRITSKKMTYNGINYPCVYLSDSDYGGLTIQFDGGKELRLIVNLEFYYVYGFFLDDSNVYAFSGEAVDALNGLGFTTTTIPYGDGYYDIKTELTDEEYYALLDKTVELPQIIAGLNQIIDTSIPFTQKAESILTVFWSLIEGIRFAAISNTVAGLIKGNPTDFPYNYFYELAEIWAKLCVIAYYEKRLNPEIAVYDLHQVQ